MERIDTATALRALAFQLVGVAVLGLATGLTLPHSAFVDWGWLIGPLAWLVASLFTARMVGLAAGSALVGAVLSGVPSALATLTGFHWLGALIAIGFFALWCGFLAARA